MNSEWTQAAGAFVHVVRYGEDEFIPGGTKPEQTGPADLMRLDLGGSTRRERVDLARERRESLRVSITAAIAWQRRMMIVPIVAISILYLAAIAVVLSHVREPKMIAALFAATGLSLTLPVRWLVALSRELWRIELIAVAIPSSSDRELAAMLEMLLQARVRGNWIRELLMGGALT